MPVIINGSTGISGTDGSAGTPAVQGTDTNTGMFFPAADQIAFAEGGTEVMRLDANGNVGIGTSSPLNIANYRNVALQGGSVGCSYSLFNSSGVEGGRLQLDGAQITLINNTAALPTTFATNGAERARITSGGNLLIGTTTDSGYKLRVNGLSYFDNLVYFPAAYNQTTGNPANAHIASDGNLFRSTSSRKYKRDIQDATFGLNDVLALRPVTYKGKSAADGETVFGGLIAEEVHETGLTHFVQYAEDGTPDALAYGNMVALCIKAIQELKAENDTLKARVAALEATP